MSAGHIQKDRSNDINFEAWARNAVAFIRSRDLENEFSDWCGGWPVPVAGTAPMIAAAPDLLEALEELAEEAHRNMVGGAGHLIDNAWAAIAKARDQ